MRNSRSDSLKQTAISGLIIALAVALGFALAFIPNIELVTLTLALGGALLGPSRGAITGAIGFGTYSLLSPYGIAPPPLFAAQIIGGAIIGLGGAFIARLDARIVRRWLFNLSAGLVGACVTFIYDLLTNIGSFIAVASSETLMPFLIGGIAFSAVHVLANGLIFGILFPLIAGRFRASFSPR